MIAKLLILLSLVAVLYAVPIGDSEMDAETKIIIETIAAAYNWSTSTLHCVIQCMQGNKLGIIDNYVQLWNCAGSCL